MTTGKCKKPGCEEPRLERFGYVFQHCADHTSEDQIARTARLEIAQ